jgi:gamma-glutamyltranspeptidase
LRVRSLASGRDTAIVSDLAAEHPAWAPSGDRLAFTASTGRGAVLVTPLDGAYVNLVAARYAAPAWSADGATLALAELPPGDVGYNGDPDRLGDRDAGDLFARAGRLWLVAAPAPPAALTALAAPAVTDRARHNADAFERVWSRTNALYYTDSSAAGAPRRARWRALREAYRPRALAARSDDELESVTHRMIRERPPLRESATGRAAVSSAHPVATAAGLEMLRRGGNVVDAAVAVSFTLGVVEPDASGIGGYGQMLVLTRGMREPVVIDFMARAPEEATLSNAALLRNGRLPDDGPVLAIVPGTVAAMHLAWRQHGSGRLPWAELLAPAIRAARDGYVVSEGLATTLTTEREHFTKYESSRKLFLPTGEPLRAGDTLRNADLAWTLEQVARGGADAFYKGEVGRRMVADLRGQGNPMTRTDLQRYYATERAAVATTYRGRTVYSSAPPVSGGATLAAQLNLLERFAAPRPYPDDAGTLHAMASAWQLVPPTRGRIADPGLWPVTVAPFTSKDTALARWRCFDPARALTTDDVRSDSLPCAAVRSQPSPAELPTGGRAGAGEEASASSVAEHRECDPNDVRRVRATACHSTGTTAFVVADAEGNVVSVTQTLGTWGGNFYVSPGLGFLYNDKLGSYASEPEAYGARLPYARHGSTLAPTIVLTGEGARRRPLLAVGAAGNAWITAAVYQTLIGMLDQRLGPQAALELPRFLPAGRAPDARGVTLLIEDGFAPDVERRMEALGYRLQKISLRGELRMGYGAAVVIGERTVTAGADPRRSGAAGAVP